MSKQRPILFSTPMVQAILEGRKTQTRRTKGLENVNLNTEDFRLSNIKKRVCRFWDSSKETDPNPLKTIHIFLNSSEEQIEVSCPYGQVGDLLWVRETWYLATPFGPEEYYFGYKVADVPYKKASSKYDYHSPDKWKPSIHMPKEAARIWLRITRVGVERLQNIKREDCINEGIGYLQTKTQKWNNIPGDWYDYERKTFAGLPSGKISPSMSFKSLWQSINGENSWDSNPWVWVIEFERCDAPALKGGAK